MLETEIKDLFTKYRAKDGPQAIQQALSALNYVANELILASPSVPAETQVINSKGVYLLTIKQIS
jgi:hypothetical protein